MADTVKIRVWVDTGFTGTVDLEDEYEVDADEWNSMSPIRREGELEDMARGFLDGNVKFGAEVVE